MSKVTVQERKEKINLPKASPRNLIIEKKGKDGKIIEEEVSIPFFSEVPREEIESMMKKEKYTCLMPYASFPFIITIICTQREGKPFVRVGMFTKAMLSIQKYPRITPDILEKALSNTIPSVPRGKPYKHFMKNNMESFINFIKDNSFYGVHFVGPNNANEMNYWNRYPGTLIYPFIYLGSRLPGNKFEMIPPLSLQINQEDYLKNSLELGNDILIVDDLGFYTFAYSERKESYNHLVFSKQKPTISYNPFAILTHAFTISEKSMKEDVIGKERMNELLKQGYGDSPFSFSEETSEKEELENVLSFYSLKNEDLTYFNVYVNLLLDCTFQTGKTTTLYSAYMYLLSNVKNMYDFFQSNKKKIHEFLNSGNPAQEMMDMYIKIQEENMEKNRKYIEETGYELFHSLDPELYLKHISKVEEEKNVFANIFEMWLNDKSTGIFRDESIKLYQSFPAYLCILQILNESENSFYDSEKKGKEIEEYDFEVMEDITVSSKQTRRIVFKKGDIKEGKKKTIIASFGSF